MLAFVGVVVLIGVPEQFGVVVGCSEEEEVVLKVVLGCWWLVATSIPPNDAAAVAVVEAAAAPTEEGGVQDKPSSRCCRLWNGIRMLRILLSGLLLDFTLGVAERPHCFLHLKANLAHASE